MAKYQFPVVVEKGETNYGAYLPDIDGCIAVGSTPQEALERMKAALKKHLQAMVRDHDPIPEPSIIEYVEVDI